MRCFSRWSGGKCLLSLNKSLYVFSRKLLYSLQLNKKCVSSSMWKGCLL